MSIEKINDVEISCNGIDKFVDNNWNECEALFTKHKYFKNLKNSLSNKYFVKTLLRQK